MNPIKGKGSVKYAEQIQTRCGFKPRQTSDRWWFETSQMVKSAFKAWILKTGRVESTTDEGCE